MKNVYLFTLTLLICVSIHGQKNKNNYDSKWFIGFNYGATWSSSDIDNSWDVREPQSESLRSTNPTGWSLFLGKSFNYEYGKMLSFDLRGRYLRGHWYGQNRELDSSMTSNISEVQDIYDQYNSAYGGFIPNYYTKLDRLSLEFVIHLNRLREKTGIDPYIFGGLGLSWKSIMADLTSLNEFGETNLYTEEQMLNNDLDFDFETNLIERQKYFMPSLGFGLEYDFGNASIGLEHKTTFTRGDQFDGYFSEAPRLENDLYHYTSAFLRLRFGGSGNRVRLPRPLPKPPASASGFTSCPTPVVDILNANNTSSTQSTLVINAILTNVNAVSEVQLTDINDMPLPFDYDANTNKVTAMVSLVPGNNTFTLKATTNCGGDREDLNIQNTSSSSSGFTNCPSPVVNILNTNNIAISQGTLSINAQIENINNVSEIMVKNANQVPLPFNFDANTNMLATTVTLIEGNNVFYISAANSCGGDTEQITIQHTNINCPAPTVSVINGNNSSVVQGIMNISAQIENINNISEISFTNENHVVLPFDYDFNSRKMTASVNLSEGNNIFYISAVNNCGGDSDQLNIQYTNSPCPSPVVNILNANNVVVNQGILSISAQITNVNNASEIRFTDINQSPLLFNYNSNTSVFSASVSLNEGSNTFFISGVNNCGSDTDRLNIEYSNCTVPTGEFISPATNINVESSNIFIKAHIFGITDGSMVNFFLNNTQLFGFNFHPSSGLFESNLSLEPGQNLIRIDFANNCGQGTINTSLFYNQCEVPVIEFIHPSASGATSNNQNQNIDIQIAGTDVNKNNINVKLNGKVLNISTASFTNQLLSFPINLIPGINTVSVDVQNDCGYDSEIFTIDFENCITPSIVFNGIETGIITLQQNLALNITINEVFGSQNISYSLNGKNVSGLQYNAQNKILFGSIGLIPGDNYFTVNGSNDCGTAIETIHVIYNDCKDPAISITSMGSLNGGSNISTNNPEYSITANLSNVNLASEIAIKHNGKNINFSFSKGKIFSNIILSPGLNEFNIIALTPCGEASANLNIAYDDCQAPSIILKVPKSNAIESPTQKVQIVAKIINITLMNQITVLNNGSPVMFAFNNGILKAQIKLNDDSNVVIIKAENQCGENTESISITYEPCQTPEVVLNAGSTPSVVTTSAVDLSALINNYNPNTSVTITVNGHSIANSYFQITNGNLSASIPLTTGTNTVSIYAVSPCGSDSEMISISRCKNPSVNWIYPTLVNTVVNSQSFTLQALANNALDAAHIQLNFNGSETQFDYNNSSEMLTSTVNLVSGNNVFTIRIKNSCGFTISNMTVIYNPTIEAPQNPGNNNNGNNSNTNNDKSSPKKKGNNTPGSKNKSKNRPKTEGLSPKGTPKSGQSKSKYTSEKKGNSKNKKVAPTPPEIPSKNNVKGKGR